MRQVRIPIFAALAMLAGLAGARAEGVTLCTAVADAETGKLLRQEGDGCGRAVTAASTFKIAISLMGFDSGFLKDEHAPALPFREGYADWIPAWRATTDPTGWIANSVVWYSQQVTQALGEERFRQYVADFRYGNEDVSGDPGKHNGLTRAWLSSSLEISPLGQVEFLRKLVRRELPVSPHAYEMTEKVTDLGLQPGGWRVHGKTGAGFPRNADGSAVRGRPYGWFVGWAEKDKRTIVFARLVQYEGRQQVPPGPQTRDGVMRELFSGAGAP